MSATAVRTCVEVLHVAPETERAAGALRALMSAPDVWFNETDTYTGGCELLLLWGPGEPSRVKLTKRHLAAGGHVLALDLAYWQRETKFRISIDAAHPQVWVMRRDMPQTRLDADRVALSDSWDLSGPVVVAGIGAKATVQYGSAVRDWEDAMIAEALNRGATVWYRPKKDGRVPEGAMRAPSGPIDDCLRGASLVITWHSNVAVDAIRMGIPVICRDGAAAAICPSAWPERLQPLDEALRLRFLSNLAYFQWAPKEAAQEWAFLKELLS